MTATTPAKFIVIEGADGAGTTTQARLLADWLRDRERAAGRSRTVLLTREPSDGPVGQLIRSILRRRVVLPCNTTRNPDTLALLFAADRSDHLGEEVERVLGCGGFVVCDRYDLSTMVYQGLDDESAERVAWLRELNARASRPDLTLVLTVSPDESARRRGARGAAEELFEREALQARIASRYRDPDIAAPHDVVVYVDGQGTVDEVAQRIRTIVEPLLT